MPYLYFRSRKGAHGAYPYVPIVAHRFFMVDKIIIFRKYG
jgi:hypothetical protein